MRERLDWVRKRGYIIYRQGRAGARAGGYICIDDNQGGYLQREWLLHLLCRALALRLSMERRLLLAICADDPPILPTRGCMS